ncbi:helix-turn-helix transcriptional regulator [[Actinomadura] parvosata]|uniref:helix-turn-helix transcriptional regulator n=1 Tax=[Actinomadura] parvosata TaxID=1955412 RepID=UPI00406C4945
MTKPPTVDLIGREPEQGTVRQLLDATGAGRGGTLLVHGAAGVGKSALIHAAQDEARNRGFTVLSAVGVETELWFPFAALHQFVQPLRGELDDLADTHRQAVRAAFSGEQVAPGTYQVALAILELLADAADRRPLLVVADDLQWMDLPSREVLAFVARRVGDQPILVLLAARTSPGGAPPVEIHPQLTLGPLSEPSAQALLDTVAPRLSPHVRTLILDRAAGNPLALVELPKAVKALPAQPNELPLTQRLEAAFAARTGGVTPVCRMFLLALAAEPDAPLQLLLDVAGGLTGTAPTVAALQEATDAGLVSLADGVPRFGHPLMRSAIYTRAPIADRLAVHGALASALSGPDRKLAHEAAATLGPDEELATRLEHFAEAAQAHGNVTGALPALRQAARLVHDPRRRTGMLIRAAELATELSDPDPARALLASVDVGLLGPVERGRLMNADELVGFFEPQDRNQRVHDLVGVAAEAYAGGAPKVGGILLWRAAVRCFFQDGEASARAATTAELDRWDPDPDAAETLAVRAHAEPFRWGADVLARLDGAAAESTDGWSLYFLGSTARALGDFTRCSMYSGQAAQIWRRQGRLGLLTRALAAAWPRVWLGELERARVESEEACVLARETAQPFAYLGGRATAALIAALRGEAGIAAGMNEELRGSGVLPGMRFATVIAQQTDGLLALIDGRPEEAFRLLAQVFDPADPHHHSLMQWTVAPDLADAAVAAGAEDEARKVLADLPELANRLPSEMMINALAYTDAVLAPEAEAEKRYAGALAALPPGWPLSRARLQLHHGRWLRKQRRYVDAREPLRQARDGFDRLGARYWAEVAGSQLRATGETKADRLRNPADSLSPREMQIAVLAARGLSNREIGQRMFISHRTVGTYLYRIYPRLGVANRFQLAAVLGDQVGNEPDQQDG